MGSYFCAILRCMSYDRRKDTRQKQSVSGMIYNADGSFLVRCIAREFSASGAHVTLSEDMLLPRYFLLSLMPDGSGRRLCSKVWQLALTAGVRFVQKQVA